LALDGTAAGYFEPLLGAAVCLHLWHYLLLTLPVRYLVLPVPFVPIDLHLV
jgi:hypothetical protein